MRQEIDSFGSVEIPDGAYWGPQTQRAIENFPAGERMPREFIHTLALVKQACALANEECGVLSSEKTALIVQACKEIREGRWDDQFPLTVFQSGSGTQTNMNMNEVIANRAHVLRGGALTDRGKTFHPNDDVNKSQSSNDVIPTAMHIAAHAAIDKQVMPMIDELHEVLSVKGKEYDGIVKSGRTHTMDAVPMTVGQEFKGWRSQLRITRRTLEESLHPLTRLPIGGTAVGTGLNTPRKFDEIATDHINVLAQGSFFPDSNKFHSIAAHGAMVKASAALNAAAVDLYMIAKNIRLYASGPRTGLREFVLPANEPGSSIMPGKVNPTQAEALMMACIDVIGNHSKVTLAGMNGEFQLNVAKPLIIAKILESADILTKTGISFGKRSLLGLTINEDVLRANLENSLMLATALAPHVGYDKASKIASYAQLGNITLREAAEFYGVSSADFDKWVNPSRMARR